MDGEMLRRSVVLYGMNIHFRGEGHTTVYAAYPILMMICQLVVLVLVAGFGCFSCLFPGGHPNETAFEPYPDSLHADIHKVVRLKKEANPELQGLTNHRLHQRVKEDVEVMCGVGLNDAGHQQQVRQCVKALLKNNGSVIDAAKDLGADNAAIQHVSDEVKVGHPHVQATMDKVTNDETSEASKEGSDYSQETV
jgi:hypothetical protein